MSKKYVGEEFLDTLHEVGGRIHYAKEMGIPNAELRVRQKTLREAISALLKLGKEFLKDLKDEERKVH